MFTKYRSRARRSRPFWPALLTIVSFVSALLAGSANAAAGAKTPAQKPKREQLAITTEEAVKPWTGDLDGMVKRGVIRVLTVYSKTFYFVDKGKPRGSAYDIFRLFEDDLNKKLAKEAKLTHKHVKVKVMFIPVARGDLMNALVAGKGDIAASNLTVTEERLKLVDFSAPFYRNVSEVVLSAPGSPALAGNDELSGKEVFVRKSSSYYESLVELNGRFAVEKKPAVIIKEAPEALEDEDLIEMLNARLIQFIVIDKHKADFWKQVFPRITINEQASLRTGADIGAALRKESPQLKAAIDEFIAHTKQGTTAGNTILARYLKNAQYVKDAGSESERKKFQALTQYFKQYGEKYDVDWLLMVAQGYQESQLNQGARSKVGAIGVMQVMPATGKELAVGNINEIEPNIHAGIKYMRWMIDHYYGDEPMTQLDKALFAFASYNAGAGRISVMRREAGRRGLDPNVWFRNVEYVVAEKVGAEPVTYVSNIYKYYIAYHLILESQAEKQKTLQQMKGPATKP